MDKSKTNGSVHLKIAEKMLEYVKHRLDTSVLQVAIEHNACNLVCRAFKLGAVVKPNSWLFFEALKSNVSPVIVKKLLEYGASPKERFLDDITPLDD